jgi:integrase
MWANEVPLAKALDIRPTFQSYLSTARLDDKGGTLAPATLEKIVRTARRFFRWLKARYPAEFRYVSIEWVDALRPPPNVSPVQDYEAVTLEEVRKLAALQIPDSDLAMRRDQAAAMMLFLSGMRASALGSLTLECVDIESRTIKQWPSLGVKTKNSKAATTYLLEIPELLDVVKRWDSFIRPQLPANAAWCTPIIGHWGEQVLSASRPGKNRNVALAKRMRKLFNAAGLTYKSPHQFRHGHTIHALQGARTMADYKSVSVNLMHDDIVTTDTFYARPTSSEIKQRIARLSARPVLCAPADDELASFLRRLPDAELIEALTVIAERLHDSRAVGTPQGAAVDPLPADNRPLSSGRLKGSWC